MSINEMKLEFHQHMTTYDSQLNHLDKKFIEQCTFKICKLHELGHLTFRLPNDVKEIHWLSQFSLNQCSVVVRIF